MINIFRDFYGNGFTLSNYGMSEHFTPGLSDNYYGSNGSYIYRDWSGQWRADMAPGSGYGYGYGYDLGGGLGLIGIGAIIVGSLITTFLVNFNSLFGALVYLAIAILLILKGLGPISPIFAGMSVYQIIYVFSLSDGDPFMTLMAILSVLLISLVIPLLTFDEFFEPEIIKVICMVLMWIGYLCICGAGFLRGSEQSPEFSYSHMSFWCLMFFALISAGSVLIIGIKSAMSLKTKESQLGFGSFALHIGIGIALLILAFICRNSSNALLSGCFLIGCYLLVGFFTTFLHDNPFTVKKGLLSPITVAILIAIWTKNTGENDVLYQLLRVWDLEEILKPVAEFGGLMEKSIIMIASPVSSFIDRFFPNLTFFSKPNVLVAGIIAFAILDLCVMLAVDIKFHILHPEENKTSSENVIKNYIMSGIEIMLYFAYTCYVLYAANNFTGILMKSGDISSYDEKTVLIVNAILIFSIVLLSIIRRGDAYVSYIILGICSLLVGIANATCTYEMIGHSSTGAEGAWKSLGIYMLVSIGAALVATAGTPIVNRIAKR